MNVPRVVGVTIIQTGPMQEKRLAAGVPLGFIGGWLSVLYVRVFSIYLCNVRAKKDGAKPICPSQVLRETSC